MKSNNSFDNQPSLFDFLNDNEISTDPIVDDTKKAAASAYTRTTNDEQRKQINKSFIYFLCKTFCFASL